MYHSPLFSVAVLWKMSNFAQGLSVGCWFSLISRDQLLAVVPLGWCGRAPLFFYLKNKIMIDFVNRNHFMGLAKHEERSQEIGMKSCKHEFFEALLNEELRC